MVASICLRSWTEWLLELRKKKELHWAEQLIEHGKVKEQIWKQLHEKKLRGQTGDFWISWSTRSVVESAGSSRSELLFKVRVHF